MKLLKHMAAVLCCMLIAATPAFAGDVYVKASSTGTEVVKRAATGATDPNGHAIVAEEIKVISNVLASGAATAANQTTANTSLSTIATNTTGVATAANQTTANTSLSTIATNTTVGTAGTPASQVTTVQGITSGTPVIVGGSVASGATDSGNPVKVGCVYNSTQPSITTGQRADLQCGSKGSLRIELFGANGVAGISALTTQADATSTAQSSINVTGFGYIYNGSSWDRVKKPNTVGRLVSAANTTNGTSVKASAADVFSINATNTTASLVYLKLYNKASAPTVGTDTPFATFALPPSNAFFQVQFSSPLYMGTGLAYAITAAAADNDTTAVASGAVVGLSIAYQ